MHHLRKQQNMITDIQVKTTEWKSKTYHTVGTIPTLNINITGRSKIDTTNVKLHPRSLSWLGTGTSIKCGMVKLVLYGLNIRTPPKYRECD